MKQKPLFVKLFQEILPDYRLESENMLDEGVAVGLIAEFILHILPVHPHHGHGAGQDQGGLVLVLHIQVGQMCIRDSHHSIGGRALLHLSAPEIAIRKADMFHGCEQHGQGAVPIVHFFRRHTCYRGNYALKRHIFQGTLPKLRPSEKYICKYDIFEAALLKQAVTQRCFFKRAVREFTISKNRTF